MFQWFLRYGEATYWSRVREATSSVEWETGVVLKADGRVTRRQDLYRQRRDVVSDYTRLFRNSKRSRERHITLVLAPKWSDGNAPLISYTHVFSNFYCIFRDSNYRVKSFQFATARNYPTILRTWTPREIFHSSRTHTANTCAFRGNAYHYYLLRNKCNIYT